jgi:5-methylcytosine-specific restriction endonuclease McrA
MPCHPARAKELLKKGKAAVFRMEPFTIILKDRADGVVQKLKEKIDPGSKKTGIALVADCKRGRKLVWACELEHRGEAIKKGLEQRRGVRRSRRNRKTRYRQARFDNRRREIGWLAPSLMSRVYNIQTWTRRIQKLSPITSIALETVRFDTQKMENPNIAGVEYQRGSLLGYEVREYLLEKFERTCIYCDKQNVPLQVEHIVCKAKGGSNRVPNLGMACQPCNEKKGTKDLKEFLKKEPSRYKKIKAHLRKPLKDVAAVNSTRTVLKSVLKEFGVPVTCWSGARTKYNRTKQGYEKTHWIDAACVGKSGKKVFISKNFSYLEIKSTGHGDRQLCNVDKFGFPCSKPCMSGALKGFRTGDLVKAVVTKGEKTGAHVGKVAVRKNGYFNITSKSKTVQGIGFKYCKKLMGCDGYSYTHPRR